MTIKIFTSNILVFVITMSSLTGLSYAADSASSKGPIVTTPAQNAFCNILARELGVAKYARPGASLAELEQKMLHSEFGGMGRANIRRMLQQMNGLTNRTNVIGSLYRAVTPCQRALHDETNRTAVNASSGGIPSAGEDGAGNQTLEAINQSVSEQCRDINFFSNECDTDQIGQGEISSFLENGRNIAYRYSTPDMRTASAEPSVCECAASIVNSSDSKRNQVSRTRDHLNQMIQDSLNKKFINSYAQNREDLQFLTAHRAKVFGADKQEQDLNAEGLICNQSAEFQSYISSRCSSISQGELNRRQQDLFKNLEAPGSSSSNTPIEDHWKNLENKIRSLPFPEGVTVPSGHLSFEREEFDKIRNGLSQDRPEVSTLGKFLTNIINSDDFKNSNYAKKTDRPYEVIRAYLDSLKNRPDFENLKTLYTNGTAVSFSSEFQNNPSAAFDKVMSEATGIHPGLRIALSEGKVFQKLLSKGGDVLNSIDNDRTVLFDEHIKDSCDRIKNDYANALCNDQSKLLSRVSDHQLDELLANQNLGLSIDVAKHVMCLAGKDKKNLLDLSMSVPKSSLLSRVAGEKDFFSEIMHEFTKPQSDVLQYLGQVTSTFQDSSVPITSSFVQTQNGYSSLNSGAGRPSILDYISEDGTVSSTRQTSRSSLDSNLTTPIRTQENSIVDVAASTSSSSSAPEQTVRPVEPSVFVPTSIYSGNAITSNVIRSPASDSEVSRTQLKDSISTSENRSVVNDHVSKVDDEQIQELTRLRDEAKRTAELAQELTSKSQQDRIKALEDQIKGIETQRQSAMAETQTPVPTPAQREFVPPTEFSVARSVSEIPGRDVASVAQAQVGGAGGGGSILGKLQSTLSSAINGNNPNSSSDISPLVITSNVVKATSPDLSQEVLRFLETEPDLSSLTQIKESGLLYRFKVVRDGKESIQEVLIEFDRLSIEARTALETKIAKRRNTNPSIERLENELANVKRTHSYESLRMIIGQQASSRL